MNNDSLVVDTQTIIAIQKRINGQRLQIGEQALLNRLSSMENIKLVMPDGVVVEVKGGKINWNGSIIQEGMPITNDRRSPPYQKILQNLEANNVGETKGLSDRQIVADAFFARTELGITPQFATHDSGIYKNLARMAGFDPSKLGKTIPEALPQGFDVTINGRTIHIIPLPKNQPLNTP